MPWPLMPESVKIEFWLRNDSSKTLLKPLKSMTMVGSIRISEEALFGYVSSRTRKMDMQLTS